MSFSKTFKLGDGRTIDDVEKEVAESVGASDEQYGASPGVKAGHAAQIKAAAAGLRIVQEGFPDLAEGNIHGHANDDGSGSFGVQYTKQQSGQ